MAQGQGGSTAKVVLVIFILVILGLVGFLGYKQGWFTKQTFTDLWNIFQVKEFWINVGILAGVGLFIGYFVPPFKDTMRGKGDDKMAAYILLLLILAGSILAAYKMGNQLLYDYPIIHDFFFDAGGNFTYNPLINVAIFWIFICFVLPWYEPIKRLTHSSSGQSNAAFYTIALIISVVIASKLGAVGVWENQMFKDAEHVLLGERVNPTDPLGGHTGSYQTTAKGQQVTKYGILKFEVVAGGKTVYPLPVLIIVYVLLSLILAYYGGQLAQSGLGVLGKGGKDVILGIFAGMAANSGTDLSSVIWLAYLGFFFAVKSMLDKVNVIQSETFKKYFPIIGAFVAAELLADVINPLKPLGPPLFEGSPTYKIFMAIFWGFIISFVLGMGKGIFGHLLRFKWKANLCKKCHSVCTEEAGKIICPNCSYLCPTCGHRGTKDGNKIKCINPTCKDIDEPFNVPIETETVTGFESWGTRLANRWFGKGKEARKANEEEQQNAEEALAAAKATKTSKKTAALQKQKDQLVRRKEAIERNMERYSPQQRYQATVELTELEERIREKDEEIAKAEGGE